MSSSVSPICLLLLFTIITNGYASTCLHCIAQGEERVCDDSAEIVECNEELSDKYLSLFTRINPDLDAIQVDKTQFKCFKISVLGEDLFLLKGCTYKSLPVCDKVLENMVCDTCEGKDCNKMYYENYNDEDGRAGTRLSSMGLIATCVFWLSVYFASM